MSSFDLILKLVDGFGIRNNVESIEHVDFSGEGSNVMYNFIPEGEMWLDKVLENEKDFFVALHSLERFFLLNGVSYADTRKQICENSTFKCRRNYGVFDVFIELYNEHLSQSNPSIWVVDGALVRRFFDPKFIQGGHDLVYDYIPKNTVWMESAFFKEYHFTLTHELCERELMGKGMKYYDAHALALKAEIVERKNYLDSEKL